MKPIKLNQKLVLNKMTISRLNSKKMENIQGGIFVSEPPYGDVCTDVSIPITLCICDMTLMETCPAITYCYC